MLSLTLIDPRQTIWLESGHALDAIGAMNHVDLPRRPGEPDHTYRQRLSVRLWEWRGPTHNGPTTAPHDDTKPRANHVRDAIEANR